MQSTRRIFIGGAWPYANGSLHLGHIAALLPGDVLARYFRLRGDKVLYVSGSDAHGTPIVVRAEEEGVTPAEIARRFHEEFKRDFNRLGFTYDAYEITTTPLHASVVREIFRRLWREGLLYEGEQELTFCPQCKKFLPDRYVRGTCPRCGFAQARGDQCDECGTLLSPIELKKPRCAHCGSKTTLRSSQHIFLRLSKLEHALTRWVEGQTQWRKNVLDFTRNVLREGLRDRAITRDIAWGVPVPRKGYENKRIYVWFEAVIGYLSASRAWAKNLGEKEKWREFWEGNEALLKHYYVQGKDNIPFHTIIWPAILLGAGGGKWHLPNQICASEYLTIEGQKLSTSRNWAVWVPDVLDEFQADAIRFELLRFGPETKDADFAWSRFREHVNNELVATLGNFVHRTLALTRTSFNLRVPEGKPAHEEFSALSDAFAEMGHDIENCRLRLALETGMHLAQRGNQFLDRQEPWKKRKTAPHTIYTALHITAALSILLDPFLPTFAAQLRQALEIKHPNWKVPTLLPHQKINPLPPLFRKINEREIKAQLARLGKRGGRS
jgi:methionyl-tRNA synthetase